MNYFYIVVITTLIVFGGNMLMDGISWGLVLLAPAFLLGCKYTAELVKEGTK